MSENAIAVKRGLDRNALKYIAAAFMVLDSVYLRFSFMPSWVHLVTRFVAPLFAYLMVDGFFHTRSRKKYAARLWIAALAMQIGDQLSYLLFGEMYGISDNIFLTLALGFSVIWLLENAKAKKGGAKVLTVSASSLLLIAGLMLSLIPIPLFGGCFIMIEGGLTLLPLILFAWLFRDKKWLLAVVYTAWCLLIGVLLFDFPASIAEQGLDMFFVNSDWLGCLAVPFFFLYSGKPGKKRSFDRSFFYIFYPAHLWMITLLLVIFA